MKDQNKKFGLILLSILAALTTIGIMTQQSVMQKPYEIKDAANVKMKSSLEVKKNTMVVKE